MDARLLPPLTFPDFLLLVVACEFCVPSQDLPLHGNSCKWLPPSPVRAAVSAPLTLAFKAGPFRPTPSSLPAVSLSRALS